MNELNTVSCGNCLDLLPKLDDSSIDMVLCDLPYGTTQNKWDSVIPSRRASGAHLFWLVEEKNEKVDEKKEALLRA